MKFIYTDGGNSDFIEWCRCLDKFLNELVMRVFVNLEYRGKGISCKLMEFLKNAARKQGYRYLVLISGELLVAAMAY